MRYYKVGLVSSLCACVIILFHSAKFIELNGMGFSEQLWVTVFFIWRIYFQHICIVKFSIKVLKIYFWSWKGPSKVLSFHSREAVGTLNMGPTWVLSAPDGPHVGAMNLAIRGRLYDMEILYAQQSLCEGNPLDAGGFPTKAPVILKLIAWPNCWTNSRIASHFRHHEAHVMPF